MSELNSNHDHRISLEKAKEFTKNYRESQTFGGKYCGFFGADAIKSILQQDGCVGVRYYYGLDANANQVLVLVGVTANGTDITNGQLAEVSVPCPPLCDDSSELMI
jgi:hypothetical protein